MKFRAGWILPLMVLTAFMPYLSKGMGIRVENAAGAAVAFWAFLVILYRGRMSQSVLLLGIVSAAIFLHIILATFFGVEGLVNLKRGLGRLDHYSRPISILLICEACLFGLSREEVEKVLVRCGYVLLACVAFNTVLQIMSVFTTIESYVQVFRPSTGGLAMGVAEQAATNNRFVGLFNQPGEQGAVYAVAVIVWVLLWKRRALYGLVGTTSLFTIIIGGALGISKMFLIGGLPVAMLLALSLGIGSRDVAVGATIVGVLGGGAFWIADKWRGAENMMALFWMLLRPQTTLYALSGGRVGGGAPVAEEEVFTQVASAVRDSPYFGLGVGGQQGFFDNEYLMALGEGGAVGLLLVVTRAALVIRESLPAIGYDTYSRGLMALGVMVAGGSMGGPITGIPRCGTVIWVFVGLLMFLRAEQRPPILQARADAAALQAA